MGIKFYRCSLRNFCIFSHLQCLVRQLYLGDSWEPTQSLSLVASGTNGEDFDLCYIFWHGKTSSTKVWLKSKFTVGFTSKGRRCGRIRAALAPGVTLQNHQKHLLHVRITAAGCSRKEGGKGA